MVKRSTFTGTYCLWAYKRGQQFNLYFPNRDVTRLRSALRINEIDAHYVAFDMRWNRGPLVLPLCQ